MTVDELVYELKLDPSNFDATQQEALNSFRKTVDEMDKKQQDLEARNKNVSHSFQDVGYAAEGLFTAIAGVGMAAFARDTANSVAATGRLATNIGESVEGLSAFGRMIERNGGSADSAMGSLKGLADSMTRFNTFGEGSPELMKFLGIIGGQQGDSPLETFMRFAEWADKNRNNPQLVNIIGQAGGLDQGSINEALKGRAQVLKDYQDALAGAVDPVQEVRLTALQRAWTTLDQSIEKTGRDIETRYAPFITTAMNATSSWVEHNQKLVDTLGAVLATIVALNGLKPALWVLRMLGLASPEGLAIAAAGTIAGVAADQLPKGFAAQADKDHPWLGKLDSFFGVNPNDQSTNTGTDGFKSSGAFTSQRDKEAFIRKTATDIGIDPDVAMRVARSEGFNSFLGDQGTSGSAFQLHVTPGGRGHAVGDEFRSLTGLNPLDPKNEHESIIFALEWAKRHGWGDFHGAANTGIGRYQGIGPVSIGSVVVNTPSTDPKTHGRIVADTVKSQLSSTTTTQANTGLQ